MAVTKIWAIHDSVSRVVDYSTNPSKTKLSDLEQVLLYAADKEKTLDEGEQQYAVTGIGCRAESAAREMAAVQRRFGKAGGNVAYHAHQSFKTGEVTAEECHRIGVETARRLWGNDRQVLVATHFNTGTYHNHFVVNPVNMWTGKKLEAKYEVYYKLRDMSDRVCKEHGLSVVKNPQRHKTARSVYFAEKDGEPTRYNLMRRALDEALTISSSWTELSAVLRKKGYVFVCDPYRRYATIRSLSAKKCMRTFRLGAEYDKEALQDRLLENQRDIRVTRRYFEFMRPYTREYARKNPPTEKYYRQRDFYLHLPRVTGYLSFFRCVAIVLGVAPLYEKEYRQPLSAECREACRRLDRFTAEITLVCREHLDTPEDVQRFLARMDKEMDAISAARSKIRNKQRGCADPVERVELKKSCAACTAELSRLRKQKQTAYNMIEDRQAPQLFPSGHLHEADDRDTCQGHGFLQQTLGAAAQRPGRPVKGDFTMKEIIKEIIEFDLDEGRMDYLDDMIDVFSKDGCEMVDILFDRFLKKYYADIDVSNERMTINLTDEEGHVLSFNLSQSEVHYVLHMVERRLNSFMRDDGGGGFSDED